MRVRLYLEDNRVLTDVLRLRRKTKHRSTRGQLAAGLNLGWNDEGAYVELDHFLFGTPYAIERLYLRIRSIEILETFRSNLCEPPLLTVPQGAYHEEDGAAVGAVTRDREHGAHQVQLRVVGLRIEETINFFNLIRGGKLKPNEPWHDAPQAEDADGALAPQH